MKFQTSAKSFQEGLQIVEAVVPTRATVAAAMHVKIAVENGLATLTATDLSALVQYTFPVEAAENGVAVVPARKLLGFVKTLKTEHLQAQYNEETKSFALTTEMIELELPGIPKEDFPEYPADQGVTFNVAQVDFHRALQMTVFAAAVDDNRFVLNGCFVHFTDGQGRIVATDSRRLALAVFTPTVAPMHPEKAQVVLPINVARLLLAHLNHETEITCTVGEKRASFQFESPKKERYYMHFNLLEGQYPNYSRFIQPLQQENRISRDALLQALKRASTAVEDREGCINLHFDKNRLEIRAKANCNYVETLEMSYQGQAITTVFSPRYIADALEETPETDVTFDMAGPQSPLVLKGHNYLYIAMPRRM